MECTAFSGTVNVKTDLRQIVEVNGLEGLFSFTVNFALNVMLKM